MRSGKGSTESKTISIRISTGTLLRVLFVAVSVYVLIFLKEIVFIIIAAALLAAVIDPFADRLKKYKIPRGISVLLIYLISFGVLASAFLLIMPEVLAQLKQLYVEYFPFFGQLIPEDSTVLRNLVGNGELFTQDIQTLINAISTTDFSTSYSQLIEFLRGAIDIVAAFALTLLLSFYMVVEEGAMKKALIFVTPNRHKDLIWKVARKVKVNAGQWMRGQLLLMLIVSVLVYIGLVILQVPFAPALAFLAGLLEIIIFIGPFLSVIPAAIIGFSISPVIGGLVLALYFIIQQIEADVLTPKIMQKAIGMNPVVSIVAVMIGFEIGGVIGAILSIPLAMIAGIALREWFAAKEKQK